MSNLQLKPEDVSAITQKAFPEIKGTLHLSEDKARDLYDGKITSLKGIDAKEDVPLLVVSDKFIWGTIWLKKDGDSYTFRLQKLPAPMPKNLKTDGSIEIHSYEEMDLNVLEFYHSYYHSCAELFSPCCQEHFKIANLLLDKGYAHLSRSACDRVVELIRDLNTYDPKHIAKSVLGDDFRILLAWYSSHYAEKGPKTPFKYPKDLIVEKSIELVKEMIDRGFTFNEAESYEEGSRELFEKIISDIGKDKIPFKEKEEMEWIFPKGMSLKDLTEKFIDDQSDQALISLYKWIHAQAKGGVNEDLFNTNVLVGQELFKRGLYEKNKIDDKLTSLTEVDISEYPTIEGLSFVQKEVTTLDEVLEAFKESPNIPVMGEPYATYLSGRIVNEGEVGEDKDIDICFRQKSDPRVIKAFKSNTALPDWLRKKAHIFFSESGPEIGYSLPLHRYGFFLVGEEEMVKGYGPYRKEELSKLKPGLKFRPLKQKSGWEKNEFFTYDSFYNNWASKYLDEGIFCSKKYDGRSFIVWVLKDGSVEILTEDQMRDRSNELPDIVKEIKDRFKGHDVAFHAEAVVYNCEGKIIKTAVSKEKICEEVPREDTAYLTVGTISKEQEDVVVFHVHDMIYFDEDLSDKPYKDRFKLITENFVGELMKYFAIAKTLIAESPSELKKSVNILRKEKGSEGVFFRSAMAKYPIKTSGENRSPELAKLKNLKSVDLVVIERIPKREKVSGKEMDQYVYETGFKIPSSMANEFGESLIYKIGSDTYVRIGRSYSTSEKCEKGDIIELLVGRVRIYTKNKKFYPTMMFPKFREKRGDKTQADTWDTIKKLSKVGPGYITELSGIGISLKKCPYSKDEDICRLRGIFGEKGEEREEEHSITVEKLKYPISCPIAILYKCPYLKPYYYGAVEYDPKDLDKESEEE